MTPTSVSMFPTLNGPRVFATPPGYDFADVFVAGLLARISGSNPEELARVEIYLTTRNLQRAVVNSFIKRKNSFLPKLSLLNDLKMDARFPSIPPPVPNLRIRLELMQTIKKLLEKDQRFASHLAQYDLTRTLESLLQELSEENIAPEDLRVVDRTNLSSHWKESLKFLEILASFVKTSDSPGDEARRRLVIDALTTSWEKSPPNHHVIVAGSTGSIGSIQYFMQKVANLPQGALVLPCFDFDQPSKVWESIGGNVPQVDHPQYRFYKLATNLEILPKEIPPWYEESNLRTPRSSLVSLALRPAPVTNQWKSDGPKLTNLVAATEGLTLVEAPTSRLEAVTIALQMRKALEDRKSAALVTPDKSLIRKVRAALRKWGIHPHDSRGSSFVQTSHGSFLQSIANLIGREVNPEEFISLLKHPLTHSGSEQENHMEFSHNLEFFIRSKGPEYDPMKQTGKWVKSQNQKSAKEWFQWFTRNISRLEKVTEATLEEFVDLHKTVATSLAGGTTDDSSEMLWNDDLQASQEASKIFTKIKQHSSILGKISSSDYTELYFGLSGEIRIRNRNENTSNLFFWNTEDARTESPDLFIAGGLNEGAWPIFPDQDPWLNRNLRNQIGLNLPEARIGLTAHDFQQIVSGKEVILSRNSLGGGEPTTPSRWLSRLTNLLAGLDPEGVSALANMKARGDYWLRLAESFEKPVFELPPYQRPQISPPVHCRPDRISVTAVRTLITDPYAIYAKDILELKPVYRLKVAPTALLKGIKLHAIMEQFVPSFTKGTDAVEIKRLLEIAREALSNTGTFPVVEEVWLSTLAHKAQEIVDIEKSLREGGKPEILEERGSYYFENLDFTLTAKCDRIDLVHDTKNEWHLFDYKSGAIPTPKQILLYEKQIPLQTIMAEKGAFSYGERSIVSRAAYIGIGNKIESKEVERMDDVDDDSFHAAWVKFQELIGHYQSENTGYISRRYGGVGTLSNDYDHLARYGEWEDTEKPFFQKVGDE